MTQNPSQPGEIAGLPQFIYLIKGSGREFFSINPPPETNLPAGPLLFRTPEKAKGFRDEHRPDCDVIETETAELVEALLTQGAGVWVVNRDNDDVALLTDPNAPHLNQEDIMHCDIKHVGPADNAYNCLTHKYSFYGHPEVEPTFCPKLPIAIKCPNCDEHPDRKHKRHTLVVRTNHENGTQFLGCPNFPDCKHTQEIPEHLRLEAAGAERLPGF